MTVDISCLYALAERWRYLIVCLEEHVGLEDGLYWWKSHCLKFWNFPVRRLRMHIVTVSFRFKYCTGLGLDASLDMGEFKGLVPC